MTHVTTSPVVVDPSRVAAARRALACVPSDAPDVLRLTRLAADLLGARFAAVSLLDDDAEVLVAALGTGPGGEPVRLALRESLCVHVVATGAPLLVEDLVDDRRLGDDGSVRRVGLRSYAGVPVLSATGHVIGALCVGDVLPRTWSDQQLAVLSDLAATVGDALALRVAVDDADRAREAERRRAAEHAALRRIATAVAHGEPPVEVLQRAAEELGSLPDVTGAAVLHFAVDGRVEVRAVHGRFEVGDCAEALARLRHTASAVSGDVDGPLCLVAPAPVGADLWGAVAAVAAGDRLPGQACLARTGALVGLAVGNAEQLDQLVELARTDPLTGAANRRAFTERLAAELERSRRHDEPLTLAFLDIDRFKVLNDNHGHDAGDRVILELVGRIVAELRICDLLARLGGDEFALLLPETDYQAATVVVDRLRQAVEHMPLAGLDVTVTIGAAVLPEGGALPDELYRRTDQALYRAKAGGRNTVVVEQVR